MKPIPIYQVDAFSEVLFSGNPAAVCILDQWLDAGTMQAIAAENNLAETAFIFPCNGEYEIRWFTPLVEVDLCGHATLASGYILFEYLGHPRNEIIFHSRRKGTLKVIKEKDLLFLDFPTDQISIASNLEEIQKCIGLSPTEVYRGQTDFVALVENEAAVHNLEPNFDQISMLDARGLIVSSRGDQVDFVSRFFAPQSGINEDPVTGSAHTTLTPIWADKLRKSEMKAIQLSPRKGNLICKFQQDRCLIGGKAVLYFAGEIFINEVSGN